MALSIATVLATAPGTSARAQPSSGGTVELGAFVGTIRARAAALENSQGMRQGFNDFNEVGYDGPCPPRNSTHRYIFDLYALDTRLNLPAGALKPDVVAAMNNHILAHGQVTGRYQH